MSDRIPYKVQFGSVSERIKCLNLVRQKAQDRGLMCALYATAIGMSIDVSVDCHHENKKQQAVFYDKLNGILETIMPSHLGRSSASELNLLEEIIQTINDDPTETTKYRLIVISGRSASINVDPSHDAKYQYRDIFLAHLPYIDHFEGFGLLLSEDDRAGDRFSRKTDIHALSDNHDCALECINTQAYKDRLAESSPHIRLSNYPSKDDSKPKDDDSEPKDVDSKPKPGDAEWDDLLHRSRVQLHKYFDENKHICDEVAVKFLHMSVAAGFSEDVEEEDVPFKHPLRLCLCRGPDGEAMIKMDPPIWNQWS